MKKREFRGAIFDMDGLLVDSEPFWMQAEKEVFGAVGLELTEAMCQMTKGLRIGEVVQYWYQRFDLQGTAPQTTLQLEARVSALIARDACALDGVVEAL